MHDRARMYATTHTLGCAKPHAQLQVISRAPLILASAQVLQPLLCRLCVSHYPLTASDTRLTCKVAYTACGIAQVTSRFSVCLTNTKGMSIPVWTPRRSRSVFFDCDTEPTTVIYPGMSFTPSILIKHRTISLSRIHGAQNLPNIRFESTAESYRFAQIYMTFSEALLPVGIFG